MAQEDKEQGSDMGRKYFYVSDKKELSGECRALEVKYGNYTAGEVVRTYFFVERDNGREWRDVTLYSASSTERNLEALAATEKKYLSGIGVIPNVFPALWEKDLGEIVDELVPFLSRNVEKV